MVVCSTGYFLRQFSCPLAGWTGQLICIQVMLFDGADNFQPFDDRNSPRDHVVTALVTLGEGYHNFHHEVRSHPSILFAWVRLTLVSSPLTTEMPSNGGSTILPSGQSGHGSSSVWPAI
jgi:hypothetical protein